MNSCFHCGEPIPASVAVRVQIDSQPQDFCCAGCAAAASWIAGAGLSDYYRLRADVPAPQVRAAVESVALFDRPQLAERWSTPRADGRREIALKVRGLRCAACAWLIRRIASQIGTESELEVAHIDPLSGQLLLRYDPERPRLGEMASQLAGLGYELLPRGAADDAQQHLAERRSRMLRLIVAGLGAMQAMMFAWPLYGGEGGDLPLAVRDFFRWVGALVTAPVVLYGGWPFMVGAFNELRLRRLGMDTPIALAIVLAFSGSLVATAVKGEAVYFESVAMFVFLLLLGRSAEASLRERARSRLAGIADELPQSARRLSDAGEQCVALFELEPGDRLRLLPGETVPVDGVLIGSSAQISEAFLSGESTAISRAEGAEVLAGSVVVERPITLQVLRVGAETALGELERLVQRAGAGRVRWTRLADQAAQAFVLVVLAAALATGLAWAGSGAAQALAATVAVLAAACPCALSLALPAALSSGAKALAGQGVLLVREGAMERLAEINSVVFDKTGTLTCEPFAVRCLWSRDGMSGDQALALAAALERCSLHPLAAAFAAHDDPTLQVTLAEEHTAAGVSGSIDGRRLRLGKSDFAKLAGDDQPGMLHLSDEAGPLARFQVSQQLRGDAAATVAALRAMGLPVTILSGDGAQAVAEVAAALGLDGHVANCSPEDKLAELQRRQADGEKVLMIGDGLNDAAVLAAAHASLALASGVDLARREADGVVLGGKLQAVVEALRLALQTRAVVRQNLIWASVYNVSIIPAAALGLIGPWIAALGMSLSSLLVIGNALRLLRRQAGPAARARALPLLERRA